MKKTVFCIIALLTALLLCAAASAETFEIYPNIQMYGYDLTPPDISGFVYEGAKDAAGRFTGTITINTGNAEIDDVVGHYIPKEDDYGWDNVVQSTQIEKGLYQIQVPEGYVVRNIDFWFKRNNQIGKDFSLDIVDPNENRVHFNIFEGEKFVGNLFCGIHDHMLTDIYYKRMCGEDQVLLSYPDGNLDFYEYSIIINNHDQNHYISGFFNEEGNLYSVSFVLYDADDQLSVYNYDATTGQWTEDWDDSPSTGPAQYDITKIVRYLNARASGRQIRPTDVPRDFASDLAGKNGLVNENGQWVLYKDGAVDTSTYGIMEYNGGRFFVANGTIIPNSGLVSDGTAWYYLSSGQVADYTGLASYDGAWFYVTNGMLDTGRNGIVSYDGAQFMLAAGRIVTEANGLIQDPVSGKWYFVSGGQVASNYRGPALYDGQWFYVWDGVFQSDAEGWVEHDGAVFYVVNGMVTGN